MSNSNDGSVSVSEVKSRVDPPNELRDLRTENAGLRRKVSGLKQEVGHLDNYFQDIKESLQAAGPVKIVPYTPAKSVKVGSPCTLVAHFTDWHYGARQESDEIEGMGEFNVAHCSNRVLNLAHDILDWVQVHRHGYEVPKAAVIVTGDLISGDIHDELRITNELPSPAQAVGAARLLANVVGVLAANFPEVVVHFIVADNHSRLTKKPIAKEEGLNSHNYVVGEMAKAYLTNQKNVAFNVYPRFQQIIEVERQRYLIMHGHGVMGWMGFPYYGIERRIAREAIVRMNQPDFRKFHKVIMGHWHTPMEHPQYWIGGSVSGTDAYDRKNGRVSKPTQTAWFVHPKHGEFDRTVFDLRDDAQAS